MESRPLNLSNEVGYNSFQLLRDRTSSTYDNLLVVSLSRVDDYSGQYGCSVRNSFGSTSREATFVGNLAIINNITVLSIINMLFTKLYILHDYSLIHHNFSLLKQLILSGYT